MVYCFRHLLQIICNTFFSQVTRQLEHFRKTQAPVSDLVTVSPMVPDDYDVSSTADSVDGGKLQSVSSVSISNPSHKRMSVDSMKMMADVCCGFKRPKKKKRKDLIGKYFHIYNFKCAIMLTVVLLLTKNWKKDYFINTHVVDMP